MIVGDAWIYPDLSKTQEIQDKDITEAKSFNDLFHTEFLRRGHRVHFSVDGSIEVDKVKQGQDFQALLNTNKIVISQLVNSEGICIPLCILWSPTKPGSKTSYGSCSQSTSVKQFWPRGKPCV
jgi:hypothetical protein